MKLQLRLLPRLGVLVLFSLWCAPVWAAGAAPEPNSAALPPDAWQMTWPAGALMLVLLFTAFFAMTKYEVPLPLAMTLVSLAFLVIQWGNASNVLREGFKHYADITILFTAIAVPAHMIERSQGFKWVAAWLGHQLGKIRLRRPRLTTPLLVGVLLLVTYVTAALMHNVTSILIMTPVIIRLCASYHVPSRWILSAALIASNLGGFSTRWGDTPNIIEASTWSLNAGDFMREVVPANLIVMAVLITIATLLTQRGISKRSRQAGAAKVPNYTLQVAQTAADWKKAKSDLAIDRRLLIIGVVVLVLVIVFQLIFIDHVIAIGAIAIIVAVLLERKKDRYHTLTSLGFEVYLTFAAIFVLAGCVSSSWIGKTLQEQLIAAQAAPWIIAVTGYFGTTFTEAASWATAVSGSIYQLDNSHAAAWALGGGICAGSSSLVTAASAGIILAEESQRFKDPEHAITFRRYLAFGLPFSLFMLVFYATYFTLIR
ncbi:MAG TPA: SLC13 family permease [Pyrinomonadaceae bacterium]|jgi:Na+/H+ antiporter NhaD/arsenite permease-like protein